MASVRPSCFLASALLIACKTNEIDISPAPVESTGGESSEMMPTTSGGVDGKGAGGFGDSGGAEATGGLGMGGSGGGSGGTGVIASFCNGRSTPNDVLATDYSCLDFDNGMPSETEWTPRAEERGMLSISESAAFSAPASLELSVGASGGGTVDASQLRWSSTGGADITAVSVDFQFMTTPPPGIVPDWSRPLNLVCVELLGGNGDVCVTYSVQDGLAWKWSYSAGSASGDACDISASMMPSSWNEIQLTLTVDGMASLQVGSSPAEQCSNKSDPASGVDVSLGFVRTLLTETGSWSANIDNVEVVVKR